ncbi:hypothetical protein [Burkholderia pseudomallei]|uniref:hypothetical protein n=1 Tax=Burkholderia pseudomallei TaxID=28450 RepID=UPI00190A3CA9|nr:hypothetical protein [Burkholderia pseudomallei]MBK3333534.1 hypothetical protein [Burkholderia pseudomallei]
MTWKRGDWVHLECDGHTLPAMVLLASANGKSLMLGFDAVIDGHVGTMPVLRSDDGMTYVSIVTGIEVHIRPAAPHEFH